MPAGGARQGAADAGMRPQEAVEGFAAGLEAPGRKPFSEGPLGAQLHRSAEVQLHGSGGSVADGAHMQVTKRSHRTRGRRACLKDGACQ